MRIPSKFLASKRDYRHKWMIDPYGVYVYLPVQLNATVSWCEEAGCRLIDILGRKCRIIRDATDGRAGVLAPVEPLPASWLVDLNAPEEDFEQIEIGLLEPQTL